MNLKFLLRRMLRRPQLPGKASGTKHNNVQGLSKSLDRNLAAISSALGNPVDLSIRKLSLSGRPPADIAVVFLRTMANNKMVRLAIVEPLVSLSHALQSSVIESRDPLETIKVNLPTSRAVEEIVSLNGAVTAILEGKALLVLDGVMEALSIDSFDNPVRAYERPTSEATVEGPQIGLTESVHKNLSLIRARLRHQNLTIERLVIGRKSKTEVRMVYLREIAPHEIVSELRRRLVAIDTDIVLDPGMIRDLIGERPYSPFIIERMTERPDTVVAELNAGRIAILVDGSPFVMLQPSQFFTLFETAEDYYMNAWSSTLIRFIRVVAYVLSTMSTPLYVAVVNFHHELLPLPLVLNIAATQEGVPLPLPLTAFITEIVLDVVREAGVRLPQQFGPAVSIVGALVLGQSAIQAGFVPPGLIIVVMFSTIASFTVPRSEKAIAYRLVRFPLLFLASTLGFPGLTMGIVALVYHVASLKTLGVPYFTLYTPGNVSRLSRKLVKAPAALEPKTRPLGHLDRVNRGPMPKPRDPKTGLRK